MNAIQNKKEAREIFSKLILSMTTTDQLYTILGFIANAKMQVGINISEIDDAYMVDYIKSNKDLTIDFMKRPDTICYTLDLKKAQGISSKVVNKLHEITISLPEMEYVKIAVNTNKF